MDPFSKLNPPPKRVTRTSMRVDLDDYEYFCKVFPEHSLRTKLPAILFRHICDFLRTNNIEDYYDRTESNPISECPTESELVNGSVRTFRWSDAARLLSDIDAALDAYFRAVDGRITVLRPKDPNPAGKSSNVKDFTKFFRQGKSKAAEKET